MLVLRTHWKAYQQEMRGCNCNEQLSRQYLQGGAGFTRNANTHKEVIVFLSK
jgi:hypothetical protein